MNAFSKVVAIIVACILMFIFPVYSMSNKADDVVETYVDDKTATLVDTIRNTGKLTKEMYDTFSKQLSGTDNLYDIKITHQHAMYYPVYDDSGVATGDVELVYENIYQDTILEEVLNGSGVYRFSVGDYISVVIKNTNRTMSTIIEQVFLKSPLSTTNKVYVSKGGRIRDEN